jgi:hypothetical protein
VFDSSDDIAFWIVAFIGGVVLFGLLVAAAHWLLDKAYGQK